MLLYQKRALDTIRNLKGTAKLFCLVNEKI